MTEIPTSGAVLQWAREFRGLSEHEAAELLGVEVEDLLALEAEQRFPTKTLFDKMAARYRLPQATLFLRTRPKAPPDLVDFRSLAGEAAVKHSFDFNVALSNVRTLIFMADRVAADDDEFVPPELPKLELANDPESAGERERKRVGVEVDKQIGWKDADAAFRVWRSALEAQGVIVFQQKFPLADGRGFSLYESPSTPVAVVNKTETVSQAKAFTLWHEYAHLLLRRPGISDEGGAPVEAWCNKFAAAFLIPSDALRRLMGTWPNAPVEWQDTDIREWAGKLKVSRYALALRLEQKEWAPSGFAQRYRWSGHQPQTTSKLDDTEGKGSYPRTRMSELGGSYMGRVLSAYDRRAIDDVQLVDAIGLGPERITDVRAYVTRGRERLGVG